MKTQNNCAVCGKIISKSRNKNNFCSKRCEVEQEGYCKTSNRNKEFANIAGTLENLRATIRESCKWADNSFNRPFNVRAEVTAICSDIHVPNHSAEWLERFLIVADKMKATHCVMAGDLFTQTQFSRHAGSYKRSRNTFDEELEAAELVLKMFAMQFKEVICTNSNHDEKILRHLGGEVGIQRFGKMITDMPNVHFTPYSFVILNNDTCVGHPRGYSKIRGKKAADIAQNSGMNIITGHEHHTAFSVSMDGKRWAIANGCLVDIDKQDYTRLEMRGEHAEPLNGFTVAWKSEHGTRADIFHKFSPWHLYGIES